MATRRQRVAVDKLVESNGNVAAAMRAAGYAPSTVNQPSVLTESLGFKELMKEAGLSEKLIATSLAEDIERKPQNRVSELRLGAEILGMNKKDEIGANNVLILTFDQAFTKKEHADLPAGILREKPRTDIDESQEVI